MMDTYSNQYGTYKTIARQLAVAHQMNTPQYHRVNKKRNNPRDFILALPGVECLCLRHALKQGHIDKHTAVLAVEREKKLQPDIELFLDHHFKKWALWKQDICSCDIEDVRKSLDIPDWVIDWGFVDQCGMMTLNTMRWLCTGLIPNCMVGAKLALTVVTNHWGYPFYKWMFDNLKYNTLNKSTQRLSLVQDQLTTTATAIATAVQTAVHQSTTIDTVVEYRDRRMTMVLLLMTCGKYHNAPAWDSFEQSVTGSVCYRDTIYDKAKRKRRNNLTHALRENQ